MNKIIFLDFDGVIVLPDMTLDRGAISNLNSIIMATGAGIVFATGWRESHSNQEMEDVLLGHGLYEGTRFYGGLPILTNRRNDDERKGHELRTWLQENPPLQGMVVLDDCAPCYKPFDRWVVEPFEILEFSHIAAAIIKLSEPSPRINFHSRNINPCPEIKTLT